MVSFPFPLLRGVRLEWFASSDAAGLAGLGQPVPAHLQHRTWQRHRAKRKGAGAGTVMLPAKVSRAGWPRCPQRARDRRHLRPCGGAGGWGRAAWGCEPRLPFPRETWALPSPALPTSPSPNPVCSPCLCPGVCFLGPGSLETMQNAILKQWSKSPPPQPSPYFQCVACWSFLPLFRGSAYS